MERICENVDLASQEVIIIALQVWLPMTADLTNNGVSNTTITNNGATLDASGKLGKCYAFTDNQYLSFPTILSEDTKEFSISFWVYITQFVDNFACVFCTRAGTGGKGVAVWITDSYIRFDDGTTNSHNYTFSLNTWTHICVTWSTTTKTIYVNGVSLGEFASTGSLANLNATTKIGGDTRTSTYYLEGKMNDFRLYDHCLSPNEVETLSMGLVVHYPMTGGGRSGDNLLNTTPRSYNASNYDAYYLNLSENMVAGQTYTMQLWDVDVSNTGKTSDQLGVNVFWGGVHNSETSWAVPTGHSDYLVKTFTAQSGGSASEANNAWLILYNSVPYTSSGTKNMQIGRWKLEKGSKPTPWMPNSADDAYTSMGFNDTTEYDVSGYNYHGTKVGTITYDSDTPRYSTCTVFNGVDSVINCGNDYHVQGAQNMTISLWAYLPDWTTETTQPFISCQESGGFIISRMSGTTIRGRFRRYTASDLSTNAYAQADYVCELTGWHMITVTYDTSAIKLYLDGVLVKTSSSTTYGIHFTNNVNTYIGAEATTSKRCIAPFIDGKVSDVRIYYTTLTDDQVERLYNTAVSISNNGTLMAYELVES